MDIFAYDFMIRAAVGALVIGVAAPAVGVFLVQKRMALIGDGLGHVALTGVAAGFLTGFSPLWTTLVVTALGAVAVEVIRSRGRASGDVALALLFYGGIAGGVFLTAMSQDRTTTSLNQFLFGSLTTVSDDDVVVIGVLGAVVVALMLLLRPWLAAICHDEEHAIVSGLPVRLLNLLLAITTAVTVSVAMRAVGLLLVSALLVVPVVTVQQFTRGFAATMYGGMALGLVTAAGGFVTSGLLDVPPGASIVLLAVLLFVVLAIARGLWLTARRRALRSGATESRDDAASGRQPAGTALELLTRRPSGPVSVWCPPTIITSAPVPPVRLSRSVDVTVVRRTRRMAHHPDDRVPGRRGTVASPGCPDAHRHCHRVVGGGQVRS